MLSGSTEGKSQHIHKHTHNSMREHPEGRETGISDRQLSVEVKKGDVCVADYVNNEHLTILVHCIKLLTIMPSSFSPSG